VAPDDLWLMLLCAEICETSAKFLISSSDLHKETCRVCSTVCANCADDCQRVGNMDECVDACRACAESCEKMGAVKRQNLICRTFRRTKAGIDSAGRAGRIGRVYMALGACLQIGANCLRVNFLRKKRAFFWPTEGIGARRFS
jgi:hypothetical protein